MSTALTGCFFILTGQELLKITTLNIAPLQGERHGSAVPRVFMTGSQLYTLRYVNFSGNHSHGP
ncbi:hypothetical protein SY86_06930 [Erwinia tracheiphila]|uniref:Uncharacterized protein n=1 Tax=Erwinia tracheiphila TaxID=65700 RepID=A0A0M2KD45_9GAMM|nr:hypothetical protein SY86_06930 [Erwinia tracheiphila]